jgi:3-dehydroquinate synthase
VRSRKRGYDVLIGTRILPTLGSHLHGLKVGRRVGVISDTNVFRHWGKVALQSLRRAGFAPLMVTLHPGERNKTLEVAERVMGQLISAGHARADPVVALGGGVIGDLAGFVAATYQRGVPFIQVPTTLLAQVDASIGGKVAVDHALGKNLIGAFYPPLLVLSDTSTLETLRPRERWSGLAEVVKAGLIADPRLTRMLERDLEGLGSAPSRLQQVVVRSAEIKTRIVSRDELESGDRVLLNFGHTIGHALEAATGYGPITHGEAVIAGMRAAIAISRGLGRCSLADASRALALLARFPRPPRFRAPSASAVLSAIQRDKKKQGDNIRMVLLEKIGSAIVERSVPRALLTFGVHEAIASLG